MRSFLLLLLVLAVYWFFSLSAFTLAIMLTVLVCVLLGRRLTNPTPPQVIALHQMRADMIEHPGKMVDKIHSQWALIWILAIWVVYLLS